MAVGGLVHDIGKLAIPVPILHNQGELTAKERRIVMSHPSLGYRSFKRQDVLPQMVYDITLTIMSGWMAGGTPNGCHSAILASMSA